VKVKFCNQHPGTFPHHTLSMFLAGILLVYVLGVPPATQAGSAPASQGQTSQNQQDSQETRPPATGGTTTPPAKPNATTTKSSSAKKKKTKTATPTATENSDASKKVVSQGSTAEPTMQLAPSLTDEDSVKLKDSTTKQRKDAETNLESATAAGLKPEQQETASQIKKFLDQSKDAEKEGDLPRASSLANKAKVLSDSLLPKAQ